MTRALRAALLVVVVVALAGLAAWRLSLPRDASGTADAHGVIAAQGVRAARAALAAGDSTGAAAQARAVLQQAPLDGAAFAVLAQALSGQGGEAATLQRYRIAARRAPRDVHVRSWLAAHELQAGDYPAALAHIDALLTVSPSSRATLLPMLAELAQAPPFADALAAHLALHPRWRGAVLQAASAGAAAAAKAGADAGAGGGAGAGTGADTAVDASVAAAVDASAAAGADRLFEALRRGGNLSPAEESQWINGMLRANRWGSAYARWVGGQAGAGRLSLLHNADFATAPSSSGFDWHLARTTGVVFRRGDGGTTDARLTFLGRAVGDTGLSHPLLLAPGRYRLSFRARAPDLRAERGLEWILACATGTAPPAQGGRIQASRTWVDLELAFEIPRDCEGQWLRLVNPAPAGVAQVVRGEVELAGLRIERSPGNAPAKL